MPDSVLAESTDLIPGRTVQFVWREDKSTASWYNFYVVAPGEKKARSRRRDVKYYGGWNGERVARLSQMQALQERHPQVYQWMLGVLKDVAA